jgi:hypothetical protein
MESSRSMSFREIRENEETSTSGSEGLANMFSLSRSSSTNQAEIEIIEENPQAAWKLPAIDPARIYKDLSAFHLKAITRVFVKESTSTIQQNSNEVQTISLLNPAEIKKTAKKHDCKFVHFGCIRVGINALVHKGINAYALCILRDMTHDKFTDSIIGGIVAPLSNGPVYFDCYPNFAASVTDETLGDILKLQILTSGFSMNKKRQNIAILAKGCFRYTNTMYPAVLHAPSKDSMASTLVITDALNQKVEHSTIKWEDLSFPQDWVIDTPKIPMQKAITSAQIKETNNTAVLSFPQDKLSRSATWPKPTRHPPPIPSLCIHSPLYQIACQIEDTSLSVQCPDCNSLVSLSSLPTISKPSDIQFAHQKHNPRTHLPPPSNSKDVCPHPQCSDIPFPHDTQSLTVSKNMDTEVQERLSKPFGKNLRKPSSLEIKRYLRIAKGCPKLLVPEEWMKNMMNWDLYTHPRSSEFAKSTNPSEKIRLAQNWKDFMETHKIYISFYEWYYTQLQLPPLKVTHAPLISCPVKTLSLSELGKELKILKSKKEEEDQKEQECKYKHQQYHILLKLKIQDLHFKLKTLIDTGSDLNLLNKTVIPVAYWEKTDLKVSGLGNIPTTISYCIPKTIIQFNSHALIAKFYLAEIPVACILGTPFLSMVSPHGSTTISTGQAGYFITLPQKQVLKLPFISQPQCTNDIELQILKQCRIQELKDEKSFVSLELRLQTPQAQQKAVYFMKIFSDLVCSELPTAFWKQKKHIVHLPYKEDYAGHPCKSRAIPMNAEYQKLCAEEVQTLLDRGLIQRSTSPWNCYGFYVNKHSEQIRGVPRLVVNYKPLNKVLADDTYPIPNKSNLVTRIAGAKIFSKFDLKSGFWQVAIADKDKFKTAFNVPAGHYEWNVMPFGLKHAPSKFQRVMDEALKPYFEWLIVYIDDILVFSSTFEQHCKHLHKFLHACQQAGLVLSKKKMELFQTEIKFLGHIISRGQISLQYHAVEFAEKFPDKILDKTQLQRFLGSLNYVSHFYKNCASDRRLLNQRLKKEAGPWTDAHTEAVRKIKAKVKQLPILHVANDNYDKIVESDASNLGWGAVLKQKNPQGKEEVIQFASGLWNSAEQNYSVLDKEIKAALNSIYKFELYLIYKNFLLRTDAAAMNKVLHKELRNPGDHKFARWQALFGNFDFSIEHIKGTNNSLADFLSREHLQNTHQVHIVSIQLRNNNEHIENISDSLTWEDYSQLWVPRWGLRQKKTIGLGTQVLYTTLVPEVRRQEAGNLLSRIVTYNSRLAQESALHLSEWFHDINLLWQKESESHRENYFSLERPRTLALWPEQNRV